MSGTEGELALAAAVAAAVPDAVIVMDPTTSLVWANPAAEALFGMTMADAEGLSGLDLIHPDDVTMAIVAIGSVQGKDVGTPLEIRIRTATGWRLVEVIGKPFGDDHILISLRDLTERRRWEVAGNEVERARALIQNGASITLLVLPDGEVETSSAAITRHLGLDQEKVEGRPLVELVHPDDRDAVADAVCRVVPGASLTVEARLVHDDGSVTPFALTLVDLRDDPTVGGLVVTAHDISDRVAVERDLRGALSMLQATFDATTDGILVVDRRGHITGSNQRFAEMWRVEAEHLAAGNDAAVLSSVREQVVDPEAFAAKVEGLYADPEAESHDVIEFNDGRVYERESRPQRVDGRVVGRVWSFRDVTANRRLQEMLSHQAFHDPLTGLANQALFRDRVEHAAARIDRQGGRLAVLFVDVDDFKTINDSLGHASGDVLLRVVSERLRECVRSSDTVARLGGDEFAILVEDAVEGDAEVVADRIIEAVHRPITVAEREVVVSASVGIAFGTAGANPDELLRNADLAMYTAKGSGKDCHQSYEPAMFHAALERLEVEASLRGAGARGELVVHYQPVVDMVSGDLTGFEALVRWNHPERGLLQPGSFIPFAEQSGLIGEIGAYVLDRACHDLAAWTAGLAAGAELPTVSVNVSPNQLTEPDLARRVRATLERHGLAPDQLCLEITEGALMSDPLAAIDALVSLREIGLRLAVDDFGTGYSSLAYLQRFPIDILKIDRSFVSDLSAAPESPMVAAIVQLALTLGLTPLAEGIETPEQSALLLSYGCRLAQGYLYGKPVDPESAAALVAPRCDGLVR
jgi:diguanylate cyclase (GGDEF)-like protein/PAS domain S-box-containing protein